MEGPPIKLVHGDSNNLSTYSKLQIRLAQNREDARNSLSYLVVGNNSKLETTVAHARCMIYL
jgi:hypothetical protein